MNLLYVPFIGFPICVGCFAVGLLLCCTIILAPVGLATMAVGFKLLTLKPRPKIVVRG